MIKVTRLDGTPLFVNERNIQWIEVLPDTAITFIAGSRVIVREKVDDVLQLISVAEKELSKEEA
jgi:flagellar protein FlbD